LLCCCWAPAKLFLTLITWTPIKRNLMAYHNMHRGGAPRAAGACACIESATISAVLRCWRQTFYRKLESTWQWTSLTSRRNMTFGFRLSLDYFGTYQPAGKRYTCLYQLLPEVYVREEFKLNIFTYYYWQSQSHGHFQIKTSSSINRISLRKMCDVMV
jgi:hypothetical protein